MPLRDDSSGFSLGQRLVFEAKKITGLGVCPDFIIIGGMKCGSTALYQNLLQHPLVFAARKKELRFFDRRMHKGARWYRANFPSVLFKSYVQKLRKSAFRTGEATPNYVVHPHVPKRVHALAPNAKLMLIVRNPIARAFSHYQHIVRHGAETLPFEAALAKEDERLEGEWERMLQDEHYEGRAYFLYSYKKRGLYLEQILRWTNVFPAEQLLVLESDEYRSRPKEVMARVLDFLNLPAWDGFVHHAHNVGEYKEKMSAQACQNLQAFFEPHNQQLYDYLKRDLQWH